MSTHTAAHPDPKSPTTLNYMALAPGELSEVMDHYLW
jgi:hypothetical protein